MSKVDELLDKAARFLMKRFGLEEDEPKRHSGRVFHGRNDTMVPKPKETKENPHLGSWTEYMKHLFGLMLDGHGRSNPAMQVRDRLQFHWAFMNQSERTEAMNRYQYAKMDYQQRLAEKQLQDAERASNKEHFHDVAQEVDHFMAPKGN
jgi:hypothetical protein